MAKATKAAKTKTAKTRKQSQQAKDAAEARRILRGGTSRYSVAVVGTVNGFEVEVEAENEKEAAAKATEALNSAWGELRISPKDAKALGVTLRAADPQTDFEVVEVDEVGE